MSARAALLLPVLLSVAILSACNGGGAGGPGANESEDGVAVKGELLVGVRAGALGSSAVEAVIAQAGDVVTQDEKGSFYRIRLHEGLSEEKATSLLASDDIVYVEKNYIAYGFAAPADGAGYSGSYSAKVKAELEAGWTAYGALEPAGEVVVAVLDTGVLATHEDVKNKLDASAKDFTVSPAAATAVDDNGHGTALAGIVAGESNDKGVVGVSSWDGATDPKLVTILPVKVANANNVSNHAAIAAGMNWARTNGANVILLSLGSASPSYTLQKAVQDAYAAGVLVVSAAGNDGTSVMRYPAAYQGVGQRVVSVSSASKTDALDTASKANFGTWVNLLAPGSGLTTPGIGSDTDYDTEQAGSSLAAAHVAGAAAMLWSAYVPSATHAAGKLTVDELRNAVLAGIDSYDRAANSPIAGPGGRFNLEKAVAAATAIQAAADAGAGTKLPGSVVFSGTTARGGAAVTATVVLTGEAAAPVVVTLTSDDATNFPVPASVTVLKGSRSTTFTVSTKAVATTKTVKVTATVGSVSATGTIDLTSPGVTKVSFTPGTVVGGTDATGTVTLAAAPTADVDVTLTTDDGATTSFPVSPIKVLAGKTTGTFTVKTTAVTSKKTIAITATAPGGAASGNLVVSPVLDSVAFGPTSVKGGSNSVLTVKLAAVQATDTDVDLTWTDASSALTGGSKVAKVTVLKGKTSATATVTSVGVASKQTVKVNGAIGAAKTADASLDVLPPSAVASLALANTNPLIYWDSSHDGSVTATVTLDAKAAKDTLVYVSASDSIVEVPASVKVANDNDNTVTFTIKPAIATQQTAVVVSASLKSDFSVKKSVTVTLKPALSKLALSASSAVGGATVTGTITLTSKPPVAFDVSVTSDSNRATVPATVSFTTADLTKTFTVTTVAGAAPATANISVSANGAPITLPVSVTAPALASIGLTPTSALAGATVTGTVTLGANALVDTDVTLSADDTTIVPGLTKVTVATGQKTKTFTFTVGTVAAQKAVVVKASLNGIDKLVTFTGKPAPVVPVTLASVAVNPTHGPPGTSIAITVTLSANASINTDVALASNDATIVPGLTKATVSSGSKTATVNVTAGAVAAAKNVTITATYSGVNKTATFAAEEAPATPTTTLTLTDSDGGLDATEDWGGRIVTGTVTLGDVAPAGGTVVTLQSTDSSAATVDASVTVAAGDDTATFAITTKGVDSDLTTTIKATANGVLATKSLTVLAATGFEITPDSPTVAKGASQTFTIKLNALAGPSGVSGITITPDDDGSVDSGAPTSIAAGQDSVDFSVTIDADATAPAVFFAVDIPGMSMVPAQVNVE